MKIAIYWEQHEWGGVDSHLLTLLSTWPEVHDEFVLIYNKGNAGLERIEPELKKFKNIKLLEISSYSYNELLSKLSKSFILRLLRPLIYFIQPALYLLMVMKLKSIFKVESGIDVLIANNGGYPAAWGCISSIVAAKRVGINVRLLLVHHEATRPNIFMCLFERYIDRMVVNNSNAIICPSYATRDTILERRWIMANSVRIRVIYNLVHDSYNSSPNIVDIREQVNDNSSILVGIVGRVQPYKGHEDIIFAISRMSEKDKKIIMLAIVGAGDNHEIQRLKSLARKLNVSDNVYFLGYIEGHSIDIVSQFNVLVVATRSFEGFGLTIAEAMVAGTPVLATKVGAIPEIINSSVATLVNPCSPQEISISLSDYIANKERWLQKAEYAQDHIKTISGNMSEEYRRLILECIDES